MRAVAVDVKANLQSASNHMTVAYWNETGTEASSEWHWNRALKDINLALSALGLKAVEVEKTI